MRPLAERLLQELIEAEATGTGPKHSPATVPSFAVTSHGVVWAKTVRESAATISPCPLQALGDREFHLGQAAQPQRSEELGSKRVALAAAEVVGVFPNPAALERLAGAIPAEEHDEWNVQDELRYLPEASPAELYRPAPPRPNSPDHAPRSPPPRHSGTRQSADPHTPRLHPETGRHLAIRPGSLQGPRRFGVARREREAAFAASRPPLGAPSAAGVRPTLDHLRGEHGSREPEPCGREAGDSSLARPGAFCSIVCMLRE